METNLISIVLLLVGLVVGAVAVWLLLRGKADEEL